MPKGDQDILKADPEDGTTPIANLLLEALAIAKLTGKEKGAVLYLWRVTYGWLVNGKRLKEREISLSTWSKVFQTDEAKASKILSGLANKNILLRNYLGPGKSYSYSMNTRVADWDKGCLNRQGLSEIARQGLSKTTRVALSKTTIPPATKLVSPKESIKKVLKKGSSSTDITTKKELNLADEMTEIATLYEAEIGKITPFVAQELNEAMQNYLPAWIKNAIKEAVKQNKRKWNYIKGILRNWKDNPGAIRNDDPNKYVRGKYGHMVRR